MEKGDHASIQYGTHFPNRLFVGCLPPKATADHLGKFFGTFGRVTEAKVVLDDQRRSKRFGFVSFSMAEEAERVLKQGTIYLMGKKINVGPAVKRESNESLPKVPVRIVTTSPVREESKLKTSTKPRYTYTFPTDTQNKTIRRAPFPTSPISSPSTFSTIRATPMSPTRSFAPTTCVPPMSPALTFTATTCVPPLMSPTFSTCMSSTPTYSPNYMPPTPTIPPTCISPPFFYRHFTNSNIVYMPVTSPHNQPSFLPQQQQLVFIPSY